MVTSKSTGGLPPSSPGLRAATSGRPRPLVGLESSARASHRAGRQQLPPHRRPLAALTAAVVLLLLTLLGRMPGTGPPTDAGRDAAQRGHATSSQPPASSGQASGRRRADPGRQRRPHPVDVGTGPRPGPLLRNHASATRRRGRRGPVDRTAAVRPRRPGRLQPGIDHEAADRRGGAAGAGSAVPHHRRTSSPATCPARSCWSAAAIRRWRRLRRRGSYRLPASTARPRPLDGGGAEGAGPARRRPRLRHLVVHRARAAATWPASTSPPASSPRCPP